MTVCIAAIAVIQSRVGCGQSRPTAALRQPIANDHSTPWCRRPRRDCSTEPGYPVNPPTVTLSVAALIALGPTPGIVKKLAEILDYGRLGRPDYRRHQAEARDGECLMTWAYSIDFRKSVFVRPILQAYLKEIRARYRRSSRQANSCILDEFCAVCGYHRQLTAGAQVILLRTTESGDWSEVATTDGGRGYVPHAALRQMSSP